MKHTPGRLLLLVIAFVFIFGAAGITPVSAATPTPTLTPISAIDWNSLGTGLDYDVNDIAFSNSGDLYIGGMFNNAGGNPHADWVAKWNGSGWDNLSIGINGNVHALAISPVTGDLYVGGEFTNGGYIARWDGHTWYTLGAGLNNAVYDIAISKTGDVYVGGLFTDAGGDPNADKIAKWDGTTWSGIGPGLGSYPTDTVYALLLSDSGEIYAGGRFNHAFTDPSAGYIAKWDGTTWTALGTGLNNIVFSIAMSKTGDIYAGGDFDNVGGDPNANYIAKWNGISWSGMVGSTPLQDRVYTIAINSLGEIYTGGVLYDTNGNKYISKWNGSAWSNIGDSNIYNGQVHIITIYGTDLYVGGAFPVVGNANKHNIIRYSNIVPSITPTITPTATPQFIVSDGMSASLVLGQSNFTNYGAALSQTRMDNPNAVAVDPITGKVFVADTNNNRVLRFASAYSLTNGAAAEAVLGQPDFTTNAPYMTQNGMHHPVDICFDSAGRLWVAEQGVVLRFDNASSKANGANADGVLGAPNFTAGGGGMNQSGMSNVTGIFVDSAGRLWAADTDRHRVLRFDNAASKPNGGNADGVLGQVDLTSNATAFTQHNMTNPQGVYVDSAGRLWVSDQTPRVLRFDNAASKSNGADADGVLGEPDFTTPGSSGTTTPNRLNFPSGISGDESTGRIFVSELGNRRVIVFNNAASLPNGANPSNVIGQTNFTSNNGDTSQAKVYQPRKVFFDPNAAVLWWADAGSNRVLMFGTAGQPVSTPTVVSTNTVNPTPSATITITSTASVTVTSTALPTFTLTPTLSSTITLTPSFTATGATATKTATPTFTKTITPTRTITLTPVPPNGTLTFVSMPTEDGWVKESFANSNVGGTFENASGYMHIGDGAGNEQERTILSFDTSSIPDNATITSAVLKFKQLTVTYGPNPVTLFNGFMADIRTGTLGVAALQALDFQQTADGSYGPFVIDPVDSWYTIDLTAGQTNINKTTVIGGLTQIRLRFVLDDNDDFLGNYIVIASGNALTAEDRPQLIIEYSTP